jgi:hypothetical protein
MADELINYCHNLDSSWRSHEIQDESDELDSCAHHSERLALAYNFVVRGNPTFIQITNNIRICPACRKLFLSCLHLTMYLPFFVSDQYMKQVAKIRKCEIVLRDPNGIHRFSTNGECSCKDHF